MIITPNKIKIDVEEVTDEDIALDIKETKLNLQKTLLKMGLEKEAQELEIPNIPSVFFDRNPIQEPISERVKPGEEDTDYETISEERKELLRSILFVWLLLFISNILFI